MTNLEKFIEARGKFREVMGDFMFRHEDPGDTWDIVVDYLEIPVREWGTYPSDHIIDAKLTNEQIEEYTEIYQKAYETLQPIADSVHYYEDDYDFEFHTWLSNQLY